MKYICIGKIVKGEVRKISKFKYKSRVPKKHFKVYIGRSRKEEIINGYKPYNQFEMITLDKITNINDILKYTDNKEEFYEIRKLSIRKI